MGRGSGIAVSYGIGHRHSLDMVLLWLWPWCRPVAVAPIQPVAWEPPYATNAALKEKKKKSKTDSQISKSNFWLPKGKGEGDR